MKQPKEIAEKLKLSFIHVDDRAMKKGSQSAWIDENLSIRCAIICCDKIIKTHKHKNVIGLGGYNSEDVIKCWQDVKKELIK